MMWKGWETGGSTHARRFDATTGDQVSQEILKWCRAHTSIPTYPYVNGEGQWFVKTGQSYAVVQQRPGTLSAMVPTASILGKTEHNVLNNA